MVVKIINKVIEDKNVILKLSNGEVISIFLETYFYLNLKDKNEVDLNLVKETDAYYECLSYAMRMIKKRDYSRNKLKEKLNKKFKKSTTNIVLIRLFELSLLDDKANALNFITSLIEKGYGSNKIKAKLIEKGYNINDIDFNKFNYHLDECAKKFLKNHKDDQDLCKLQQKLFRYLYNKGYNDYEIYSYIRKEVEI